jgi:hypothetical protein
MRFMLAMYSDYADFQRMTPDDGRAFEERLGAFNQALRDAGAWVSAEGLDEPARTVTFSNADVDVVDRPFAATAERLGGYWIIEANDLAAAVDWARTGPLRSGAIEVRPIAGSD